MKRLYTLLFFITIFIQPFFAQTWNNNIAEILYDNCTVCHNPKGIANSSFLTYQEANLYKTLIQSKVSNGEMPPWTADTTYQHYYGERTLTENEKTLLLDWITNGAPEGTGIAPPPPVYTEDRILQNTPDLTIQIPTYSSKASSAGDDYACFSIPTGLTTDKKIRAIEVLPGNREIVHHALIYKNDDGTYQTDTNGYCTGPSGAGLMASYTPGGLPTIFPGGDNFKSGVTIKAGANIVFAMHYPEGSFGMVDSTKVNLYFYDDQDTADVREIYAAPVVGKTNFTLPPNVVTKLTAKYPSNGVLPVSFSFMSVFPHMHLLGKEIKSYATTFTGDTIPFVNVPKWDFEWQDVYFFQSLIKVPIGSTLHGEASFDNTSNNPFNPNSPPITVNSGLNTTDEMFLVYFHFMIHESGDENVDIQSLINNYLLSNSTTLPLKNETIISTYPNPTNSHLTFTFNKMNLEKMSLYIYDIKGQLVKKVVENASNVSNITWDLNNTFGKRISPGIYFYSATIGKELINGKIIVQNE